MNDIKTSNIVSVDEALKKGKQMLMLPRLLMILGLFFGLFPFALLFIALTQGPPISAHVWLIIAGVLVANTFVFLFLPFLFWSKRTTKWKLWAFENVDNIEELKILGLQAHLYPVSGSFIDRIQIQSTAERLRWAKLQKRENVAGNFVNDPDIAPETPVYYSMPKFLVNLFFGVLVMAFGAVIIYFAFKNDAPILHKLLGFLFLAGPVLMLQDGVKNISNKKPSLILANKGIYTPGSGWVAWNDIYNLEVKQFTAGRRGIKYTLHFDYMGGFVNLDVTELAISKNKLLNLIRFYKQRFNAGYR